MKLNLNAKIGEPWPFVIPINRRRLATKSEIAKLKLLVRPIGRRRVHAL